MARETRFIWQYILAPLLLSVSLIPGYATAADEAPLLIPGTTKVSAEAFLDIVAKTPELFIIDARIPADRMQGYIEGSISLPDIETNCASLARVIPKKNAVVFFYCNGVKCGRSVKSSRIALKCGYNNIYWFRGGFAEWTDKNYPFIKD